MKWLTLAGVVCLLGLSPMVATQGTGGTAGQTAAQKPGDAKQAENPDAMFMRTAAMSSTAEVAHGQLASKNAASEEVRKFGQRMVEDHTKASTELKGLASKKQVTLSAGLDQKHQAMQDKLSNTKGDEFDRTYMQHMVAAHKDAVSLFEQESKNGKDAETRAWAAKTLPVVQKHLEMATDINAKVAKGGKQ